MSYTPQQGKGAAQAPREKGTPTDARRGDLVVYEKRTSYVTTSQGWHEATEYEVAIVTSITRDGKVKAVRGRSSSTATPIDRIFGWQRCYVVGSDIVDVPAACEAAWANPWPSGHAGMPFDSLDAARAVISAHKLTKAA